MEFHIGGRTGDSGSDIIFSDDDEGQDRCSGKDAAEGRHSRCVSSCSSCSNGSTDDDTARVMLYRHKVV